MEELELKMKCLMWMMIGAGMALIYKTYEDEICKLCKHFKSCEKDMLNKCLEME